MAFTNVQQANGQSLGLNSTVVVTLPAAPTPGNLVVVGLMWFDGTAGTPVPVTVQDANGNVYTVDPTVANNDGALAGWAGVAYLLCAPRNASAVITVTWSQQSTDGIVWAREFAPGAGNIAALKSPAIAAFGTAAPTDGPRLVASVGDLCFAQGVSAGNLGAAVSPWTTATQIDGNNSEYILSATEQQIVGWVSDGASWNMLGIVFTEGKKRFLVI